MSKVPISSGSPHLAGQLHRCGLSPSIALLDAAFDFSIQHGGRAELDFVRPADASFNPRPARVALILLIDAQERSPLTLAAAMAATVPHALETAGGMLPEEVLLLARRSLRFPPEGDDRAACLIAAALFLDRARHLHQSTQDERQETAAEMIERCPELIHLTQQHAPRVAVLLSHWRARWSRRAAS